MIFAFTFSLSRDSDLDSNSSTDISVGMEFPMSCASPSFSSSSSTTSLLDFGTDVRMRPGPRSFKMQQQMNKWLDHNNCDNNNNNIPLNLICYPNRRQLIFCFI